MPICSASAEVENKGFCNHFIFFGAKMPNVSAEDKKADELPFFPVREVRRTE
jgi:hypothetical protein